MFTPSADAVLEGQVLDEQLTALRRVEREAARAFVAQCEALQELWDTAPPDTRQGRRPHVLAEAAAALHLHPQSLEARLGLADTLQEHPLLRSMLLEGRLGIAHALALDAEIGVLGDVDLAERVLREVLSSGGRPGWEGTPTELRRAVARTVVRLDPVGVERRRLEQTRQRTGVRLRPQPDGLATWVATGEGTALTAADRVLDVLSRPAGPDDSRTRGQRQVDALLAALVARAATRSRSSCSSTSRSR